MSYTPILYIVNVGGFDPLPPAFKKDANKTYAEEGFFKPPRVAAVGVATGPEPTLTAACGVGSFTVSKSGSNAVYGVGAAPGGAHPAYVPRH